MKGRRFTWSNAREQPSIAKLDWFLLSTNWSLLFPDSTQRTLPNFSSDHCPILYKASTNFRKSSVFRVENFWLQSEQFRDFVRSKWTEMPTAENPTQLHRKIVTMQREITAWTRHKIGNIKRQLTVCRDYFEWVDEVQEVRVVTDLEKLIKAVLKKRYTELSKLEEKMWRQCAKIRWEKEGDKNSKFFHAYASTSKRNNFIGRIEYNDRMCATQKMKARTFFDYFAELMGKNWQSSTDIDWSKLYPEAHNLTTLARPIEADEILQVIVQCPNNKSPGPEGLTSEFYKEFAHVMLPDLMAVFTTYHSRYQCRSKVSQFASFLLKAGSLRCFSKNKDLSHRVKKQVGVFN
ncbi:uncharacterized protein LOC144564174 [Carex rostrata]